MTQPTHLDPKTSCQLLVKSIDDANTAVHQALRVLRGVQGDLELAKHMLTGLTPSADTPPTPKPS